MGAVKRSFLFRCDFGFSCSFPSVKFDSDLSYKLKETCQFFKKRVYSDSVVKAAQHGSPDLSPVSSANNTELQRKRKREFDLRTLITILICNLPSQDFNLDIALTEVK